MSKRAFWSWLLLVLATSTSIALRARGAAGGAAGAATVAIAYFKGRWVILDFMELRHAPRMWRLILETWLFTVSALILGVYWLAENAL